MKGTGIAIITPFNKQGAVDFIALKKLCSFWIEEKVDYLVVMGTTGESATLSSSEKHAVLDCVKESVNGAIPIVYGIGGNNTALVCDSLKSIDTSGLNGILSVSPYYNKPGQEGLYRHFMELGNVSPLPIILYNVPGRTGYNMTADTTLRLAHSGGPFSGIKEASGNLDQIMRLIVERPDSFSIISGDDSITLALLACGADGVISVIANAFPGAFANMVKAMNSGNITQARSIHQALFPLHNLLFTENSPGGIKSCLKSLGMCEDFCRLPVTEVSDSLAINIAQLTKSIQNALQK
jgi:4-hydroxy-tetrahydrodipicolinate synthase